MDEVVKNNHDEVIVNYLTGNDPGGKKFIAALLETGFEATLDLPASLAWEDLHSHFQDAIVIYTERESPAVWVESFQALLNAFAPVTGLPFSLIFNNKLTTTIHDAVGCNMRVEYWEPFYLPWVKLGTAMVIEQELCQDVYIKHREHVLQKVPSEKLLMFNHTDGWQPLCNKLGLPVPTEPFPWENTRASLDTIYYSMRLVAILYPILALLPLLPLYLCSKLCSRFIVKGQKIKNQKRH